MMTSKQKFDFVLKTIAAGLCIQGILLGISYLLLSGLTTQFFPIMGVIFWVPLAVHFCIPSSGILYAKKQLHRWVILMFESGVALYILMLDLFCFVFAFNDGHTALMFFFGIGQAF